MQTFTIENKPDYSFCPIRELMGRAKQGKPYARVHYTGITALTYLVPEHGETTDVLVMTIKAMIAADASIESAFVMNEQGLTIWQIDCATTQESQAILACTGYECRKCGHFQEVAFDECPNCRKPSCWDSAFRWLTI